MIKLKVFMICLAVMISVFSAVVCLEIYTLERSVARGFFIDIFDDMQDIGYLDPQLEDYYRDKMIQMDWESVEGDFFQGTWPRSEVSRARKERQEFINLTLRIRPSRVSQWIHLFRDGSAEFFFTGTRPSEYFAPGW